MQRLWFHPMCTPLAGVRWLSLAWLIANLAVRRVIADVRRCAARIVANEETRPAMEVHRLRMSRQRQRDLDNADELGLKDPLVAIRRSLHRVEAIGKAGLVLAIEEEVPGAQQQIAHGHNSKEEKFGSAQSLARRLHAAQYIP